MNATHTQLLFFHAAAPQVCSVPHWQHWRLLGMQAGIQPPHVVIDRAALVDDGWQERDLLAAKPFVNKSRAGSPQTSHPGGLGAAGCPLLVKLTAMHNSSIIVWAVAVLRGGEQYALA